MNNAKINKDHKSVAGLISLAAALSFLIYCILSNEVPVDIGDGIQHYSISQYSWNDPVLFLEHWNKPLFTLFSSPFAQFGWKYFPFFNVVCFSLTVLTLFKLFKTFSLSIIAYVLLPLVLITIPDYTYGIVGGMTEPLFGLILTILFYVLVKQKWNLFALIASFAPFARSEGMLIIVLALFVLLLNKQWKSIPLLISGFLLYAIIGFFVLGKFWWYFENDPYPAKSIYGSGSWLNYILTWDAHLGIIPLYFVPIALFGWWLWKKEDTKSAWTIAIFVVGSYLGIIAFHSYLWANGLKGALGLTRIATQGLPAFVGFLFISCNYVAREIHFLSRVFIALLIGYFTIQEVHLLNLPTRSNELHTIVKKVVCDLKKLPLDKQTIYYMHPTIPLYWEVNFLAASNLNNQVIHLDQCVKTKFKPGDIIIRDSQFGPLEHNIPFDSLVKYPHIFQIYHYITNPNGLEFTGEQRSLIVYEIGPLPFNLAAEALKQKEKNLSTKQKYPRVNLNDAIEFLNINDALVCPKFSVPMITLNVELNVTETENQPLFLIFKDETSGYNVTLNIDPKQHSYKIPIYKPFTKSVFFVYNPEKKSVKGTAKIINWSFTQTCGYISPMNFKKLHITQ